MQVKPIETRDPAVIEQICRLRVEVWREAGHDVEVAFPDGVWRDEWDAVSRHWVVYAGTKVVAAARWCVHVQLRDVPEADQYLRYGLKLAGPIAAPSRVVVARAWQHRGLARTFLDLQDEASRTAGVRYAVRQASPAMVRLLVHRGWQIIGAAEPDPRFPGVRFQIAIRAFSGQITRPVQSRVA